MAVDLYITGTLVNSDTSSPTEFADALGGGDTGLNLGQCANGEYSPIVDQNTNDGAQIIYLSHNATIDPIVDLKVYIDDYSGVYGGAVSAASDYSSIKAEGLGSTKTTGDKNNANGTSSGVWMDFNWDVSQSNQFDVANFPNDVKIFGDSNNGISPNTAYTVPAAAMLYAADSSTEAIPSAPADGKIGKSLAGGFGDDSTLGNRAKMRTRVYLKQAFTEGGIFQFDYAFRYSYTA